MKRKFIMKFDIKNNQLRAHMYQVESIRVEGECLATFNPELNKGNIYHTINEMLLQMDAQFDIGFKKNSVSSIRAWIKSNIFKIYIRENVPTQIRDGLFSMVRDGTVIIND